MFTVAEANRTIPALEAGLDRVSKRALELDGAAPRAAEVRKIGMAGGRPVPPHYFEGIREIQEQTQALEDRGIIVRDVRRGLVDFPAMLEGRQVFLCWLRGEHRVAYFHDPDSGFAGRQPLPPGLDRH
jgi:hypothetical protein